MTPATPGVYAPRAEPTTRTAANFVTADRRLRMDGDLCTWRDTNDNAGHGPGARCATHVTKE